MRKDGVTVAFDLILEEMRAVEAQLNSEGANAFRRSQYSEAEKLSAAGKDLTAFREKLEKLAEEWQSSIEVNTRERVTVDPSYTVEPHTKGPKSNIRITLQSGRVIQRPTAAKAFTEVIQVLGLEKVKALGLMVNGIPLVDSAPHPKYGQSKLGSWYVCTHSNTKTKKQQLKAIATALGQDILVEIVEADT
jgi:hypothetical protein